MWTAVNQHWNYSKFEYESREREREEKGNVKKNGWKDAQITAFRWWNVQYFVSASGSDTIAETNERQKYQYSVAVARGTESTLWNCIINQTESTNIVVPSAVAWSRDTYAYRLLMTQRTNTCECYKWINNIITNRYRFQAHSHSKHTTQKYINKRINTINFSCIKRLIWNRYEYKMGAQLRRKISRIIRLDAMARDEMAKAHAFTWNNETILTVFVSRWVSDTINLFTL